MDIINVVGVSKSYGDGLVLENLNLTVKQGESLVIFGANGSGKTTLLKIFAPQIGPDSGEVCIRGLPISRRPNFARGMIGVVGHQDFLYEDLTLYQNMIFFGRMYQISKLNHDVKEILIGLGLYDNAHVRVRSLSHGMRKRASLARSLLHDPEILVLDEPESGLDLNALQMMNNLRHTRVGDRRTMIITTHNMEYGFSVGDRAAVIANGRIIFEKNIVDIDQTVFLEKYTKLIRTTQGYL